MEVVGGEGRLLTVEFEEDEDGGLGLGGFEELMEKNGGFDDCDGEDLVSTVLEDG